MNHVRTSIIKLSGLDEAFCKVLLPENLINPQSLFRQVGIYGLFASDVIFKEAETPPFDWSSVEYEKNEDQVTGAALIGTKPIQRIYPRFTIENIRTF